MTTNQFIYAGWQTIAEDNGVGTLTAKYVCGPGLDEPVRMTRGGTCRSHDQIGKAILVAMQTDGVREVTSNLSVKP